MRNLIIAAVLIVGVLGSLFYLKNKEKPKDKELLKANSFLNLDEALVFIQSNKLLNQIQYIQNQREEIKKVFLNKSNGLKKIDSLFNTLNADLYSQLKKNRGFYIINSNEPSIILENKRLFSEQEINNLKETFKEQARIINNLLLINIEKIERKKTTIAISNNEQFGIKNDNKWSVFSYKISQNKLSFFEPNSDTNHKKPISLDKEVLSDLSSYDEIQVRTITSFFKIDDSPIVDDTLGIAPDITHNLFDWMNGEVVLIKDKEQIQLRIKSDNLFSAQSLLGEITDSIVLRDAKKYYRLKIPEFFNLYLKDKNLSSKEWWYSPKGNWICFFNDISNQNNAINGTFIPKIEPNIIGAKIYRGAPSFIQSKIEDGEIYTLNQETKNLNNTTVYFDKGYNNDTILENIAWKKTNTIDFQNVIYRMKNHKTNKADILLLDDDNKLYSYNIYGKLNWTKQLNGKIIGIPQSIDIYNNSKYQLLLNTDKSIYIIDILGRDVENFPIEQEGLSQASRLISYDEKNRRILAVKNNQVLNFSIEGKEVEGWTKPQIANEILSQVEYLNEKGKDFLINYDKEGNIYMYNRRGELRKKLENKISNTKNVSFYKGKGLNTSYFAYLDSLGNIERLYLDGTRQKLPINFKGDSISDFMIIKQNNQHYFLAKINKTQVVLKTIDNKEVINQAAKNCLVKTINDKTFVIINSDKGAYVYDLKGGLIHTSLTKFETIELERGEPYKLIGLRKRMLKCVDL